MVVKEKYDELFQIGDKVTTTLEDGVFVIYGYDSFNDRYSIRREGVNEENGGNGSNVFHLPGIMIEGIKDEEDEKT